MPNAGGRGRKLRSRFHPVSSPASSRGGSYHSHRPQSLENGRHPSQNRERIMPNHNVNATIERGTKRNFESCHLDQELLQNGPSRSTGRVGQWGRQTKPDSTNGSGKPTESVRNGAIPHLPHPRGKQAQVPIPLAEGSAERKSKRLKETQRRNPADSQNRFQHLDEEHFSGTGGPLSDPRTKISRELENLWGPRWEEGLTTSMSLATCILLLELTKIRWCYL